MWLLCSLLAISAYAFLIRQHRVTIREEFGADVMTYVLLCIFGVLIFAAGPLSLAILLGALLINRLLRD